MKLSIIVPCYNEAENIPLILEKFNQVIHRKDIELILVNNGSTDNSQEIFDKITPNYSFTRVVNVPINKGYGFGILSGLKQAKGEYLSYTHADMQTDPKDVLTALSIIENAVNKETLYVKGLRKNRPLFDQFFTTGMSIFETIYLKTLLWDINSQPNMFHNSFFKSIEETSPHDFSLDLYLLFMAKKKNLILKRFNVIFPPRIHGESKWNTGFSSKIKFIKRTIEFSKGLKKQL